MLDTEDMLLPPIFMLSAMLCDCGLIAREQINLHTLCRHLQCRLQITSASANFETVRLPIVACCRRSRTCRTRGTAPMWACSTHWWRCSPAQAAALPRCGRLSCSSMPPARDSSGRSSCRDPGWRPLGKPRHLEEYIETASKRRAGQSPLCRGRVASVLPCASRLGANYKMRYILRFP